MAALQLPLSRFGDVAANAFVLALLDSLDSTRDLPIPLKTGGSWCGGSVVGPAEEEKLTRILG